MEYRDIFVGKERWTKLLGILLFFLITALLLVYRTIYPLTLTPTEGYLVQIPLLYWVLVTLIIINLIGINYIVDSAPVSIASVVIFFMVYSLYQFFYSHLHGGDTSPISIHLVQENPHLFSETHFSYLEFPLFWFTHRILYLVPLNQPDVLTGIEQGFAILVFLFAIAVWIFIYINTRCPQYSFYGSIFFVAVSHYFWNFQYVPQFFAFMILLVLFAVHSKSGKYWVGIKVLLFTALVLSHPMFFVFYLASVLLYPLVKSAWKAFESVEPTRESILIRSILGGLLSFPAFFRSFLRELRSNTTDRQWVNFALIIVSVYVALFLYRQLNWQTSLIVSLQRSVGGHSAEFIDRFVPFVSVEYGDSDRTTTGEVPRELLYHLTSEQISSFTTTATMAVILTGGLLLVLLLLVRDRRKMSPFNITILLITGSYFSIGMIMNIHGTRALQVVFAPLVLSIVGLKRVDGRKKIVVGAVIILVLCASPLVVANMTNNSELVGGHTTGDYYTEQAGLWVEDKEWETIVQPRRTIYPLDIHEHRSHIDIRTLANHDDETSNISNGSLVQFDWRMYHKTQYRSHTCNFDEQNIIYDNSNKILHVHEEFRCEPNY